MAENKPKQIRVGIELVSGESLGRLLQRAPKVTKFNEIIYVPEGSMDVEGGSTLKNAFNSVKPVKKKKKHPAGEHIALFMCIYIRPRVKKGTST